MFALRLKVFAALLTVLLMFFPSRMSSQTATSAKTQLTNKDVTDLLESGLSPEIVTAKIKASACNFDTSPAALKQLKATHVPDSVILAMIQAPASEEKPTKRALVKCPTNATEVSVWLAPGKLTEVASPKCGEKLDILQEGKVWVRVRTQDGKVGYISGQAVAESWSNSEPTLATEAYFPTASSPTTQPSAPRRQEPPVPSFSPGRLVSGCSPAIESTIVGDFEGWSGETIFKLDNGQIWEQAEYDYTYDYEYRPDVTIYQTSAGCKMKVEGVDETILVRRIH